MGVRFGRSGRCPGRAAILLVLLAAAGCATSRPAQGPEAAAAAGAPRLFFVEGPAGPLWVDDGGTGGLPVVFVHGLGGDHEVWRAQLDHLRRTRRAVALDLRGHGRSSPSADPLAYAPQDLAEDVHAAMGALGIPRAVLVGHSLGGAVIAAFAERYPEEAAGLFFVDSIGALNRLPRGPLESWLEGFGEESYDTFWPSWLSEMLAPAPPEVRERVMARFAATPRPVVEAAIVAATHFDPAAALQAYEGPRMAVVTPQNTLPHSLQNVVPGLHAKVVEGVSHWLMMDRPEEFDALLDAFLETVR
ncbi:MAG: alpha/beta fold hydrolase [Acidobacteriota bacterium]